MSFSTRHALWALFKRDLLLVFRSKAELMQPMVFFVMVVSLFPLAIGPNLNTLQTLSGAILWVAAILSLLMSIDKIFRDDHQQGFLELVMQTQIPLYMFAFVKASVHWVTNIIPLLILSPLLALFLNMSIEIYAVSVLTLLIGTPTISLVGAIGGALTLGLKRQGVIVALLLIPIFIPLLIFATSAIESASLQLSFKFELGILSIILLAALLLAPYTIAQSLKVGQN